MYKIDYILGIICLHHLLIKLINLITGCFMVIYDARTKKAEIIDGRETAPRYATLEMYLGIPWAGAKSIGIPGELPAFWKAHEKYGKLPWGRLFAPTIKLADNGHYVSHSLARALRIMAGMTNLTNYSGFCDIFCDEMGNPKVEGDMIKRPEFAETLRKIAKYGPDYLYNSNITETIAEEIVQQGGVLVVDDFRNYSVVMNPGLTVKIGDYNLHTLNAPSGGPMLGLILRILQGINFKNTRMQSTQELASTYHAVIEAFKLAYAERAKLGDPAFYPHVQKVTKINGIQPGKRPLSSMAPAIFTNKNGEVQLVVGAAGGSRITTTVAQIAFRVLFLGESIDKAVRSKRIHHQLTPNILFYEFGFPTDIIELLKNRYGHEVKKREKYMAVVEIISKDKNTGEIAAFSDERKIPGKAKLLTKEIPVAEMK